MAGNSGYGHGGGYGYGDGRGYGHGYGDGYGHGGGLGSGGCHRYGSGDGYGDELPGCGEHAARFIRPWRLLQIGCETHGLDTWITDADEIDKKHGDGIADETRALALLLAKELEAL